MKQDTLKKKPGRPSEGKTTLAVLRSKLTVPKRKGDWRYNGERVPLSVKDVADWLNVTPDCVRCIERGRPGYPLTEENAEIIAHQTGVSLEWLLAGDVFKPIINSCGEPYIFEPIITIIKRGKQRGKLIKQDDFTARQKALLHLDASRDVEHARMTLAGSCAKIAAIIVRGLEDGQPVETAYKLNKALRSVFLDKCDNPVYLQYIPATQSNGRPDFSPLLFVFESRLREIQLRKHRR
jgi:hypothetical protein